MIILRLVSRGRAGYFDAVKALESLGLMSDVTVSDAGQGRAAAEIRNVSREKAVKALDLLGEKWEVTYREV